MKSDGQLNLLILPSVDCTAEEIECLHYDGFPVYTALCDQRESADSVNIRYTDSKIKVLERMDDFVYTKHESSGRRLWIYDEYLRNNETGYDDYTNYVLPVSKGDKLSLIRKTSRGYIVKKGSVSGWYYGELKEAQPELS